MEWLIDIIKEWVIAKAYATEAWVLAKVYATESWVLQEIYNARMWVLGLGYLTASFVDRGDPAAWDWTEATLVQNNSWHDLDLSGIVPAGVKCVLFRSVIKAAEINKYLRLKTKGNVNDYNAATSSTIVANANNFQDLKVAPNSDGVIQYLGSFATWQYFRFTIAGWWF